jgi:hypothetical protein
LAVVGVKGWARVSKRSASSKVTLVVLTTGVIVPQLAAERLIALTFERARAVRSRGGALPQFEIRTA